MKDNLISHRKETINRRDMSHRTLLTNLMCSKERRQQIALDIKENQMAVILKTLLEYSQTL